MKWNASLGRQFITAFTFFLVVPTAVVFIFFLFTIYGANKEKISADLLAVSQAVASRVNTGLESPAMYLTSLADFLEKKRDQDDISSLLESGIKNFGIFDGIYVLGNDKKILNLAFSKFSRYHREDFLNIRLSDVKGSYDYQYYWSRPFMSLMTSNYVVRLSVKFPDGYVVGDLSLEFLTNSLTHAKTSESTNIFIVDSNGDVISASRQFDNLVHENFFRHPAVLEAYRGGHTSFGYERDGITYDGCGFKIPVADWYLVVEQKEKAAFGLFYEILYVTLVAAVIVCLFIVLVLYLIRRKLIKPLRLLTERSKLISDGEFPEFGEDEKDTFMELRRLYDSFENMSAKIDEREKALREKEEYIRSIFDSTVSMGIFVITKDSETVITDMNVGTELITGYKGSELLGLHPAALVKGVGNDISRMKAEVLQRDNMVSARFEMVKKNGIAFPVMASMYPLRHGAELNALIVVFSDITEITRIQHALEGEKERLDVTLKSIGEGVLATDKSGRITLLNSSAENILGNKYRFMIGHRFSDLMQIYDYATGEDISSSLTSAEDTSKKSFRANIVSKNSGMVTVIITSAAMLNNRGETVGFVYVFRDITERMGMERELLNRKKQLEDINRNLEIRVSEETEKRRKNEQLLFEQAKFAAMGQMISAIAHQWRQPLNALALYTQDIEDAYSAGEVNEHYLADFVTNSMSLINHMSTTIDDFRNFFHSSNVRESVNLVDVVSQSVGLVATQLRNQNINFEMKIKSGGQEDMFVNSTPAEGKKYGGNVIIFPSEMKQVVLNILNNARDAISERRSRSMRRPGTIMILVEYLDDRIVLTISNDGGRIPEDSLIRIFDPYYTTKPEGEGTGIGLYMSKIMIEDHMGGLLIAENVDDWARFTITLYYNV